MMSVGVMYRVNKIESPETCQGPKVRTSYSPLLSLRRFPSWSLLPVDNRTLLFCLFHVFVGFLKFFGVKTLWYVLNLKTGKQGHFRNVHKIWRTVRVSRNKSEDEFTRWEERRVCRVVSE